MRKRTLIYRYEPDKLADKHLSDAYDLLLRYAVKRNNEKEVEKMITVALYARVSPRSQGQNNTIESQIAELKHRIAEDKHELLDEYEFKDDGFSGWKLEREGLDVLRDKVAEGKINKIYIHSPDRLSRKSAHQMILLDEFEKAGVEVIFLNHKTENNPESKLLLGMQGLVAEYECTKIMERSRRGKRHIAKQGYVSVMSKHLMVINI
ncbi:recombinase family protein [Wolbachia endosymbiont of Atemnus politus]|uniref:recombinase family protein n=1 Tax=Wolbachia endosymbiont of Atemnus politus TaxID=2682840 RepID=UPI002105126E|nr:recombinase family protein [Wolbachia endosymbiont of Atemnus politus]